MSPRLFTLYRLTEKFKIKLFNRFTPLGRVFLLLAGVSLFFGVSVGRTMIYQIFALTIVLLVLSFLMSLRFKSSLRVTRKFPPTCIAGEVLKYTLHLQNRSGAEENGLYYREVIRESLPDWLEFSTCSELGEEGRNIFDRKMGYYRWKWLRDIRKRVKLESHFLPEMAGKVVGEVETSLMPIRRGYAYFSGHNLGIVDPFGLCKSEMFFPCEEKILVLPKLYPVPQLFFQGSRKYHRGGISGAQRRGDSNEFLSLREYVHGDPLKHIDWKSTARTGRPIVRQYRDEYFSRYGLILDSFTPLRESPVFEEAVSLASSIVMTQDCQNSVLDLLFVETECVTLTIGSGHGGAANMLELLATIGTCRAKPFEELANMVKSHISLLSGVVVILIDYDAERKLLIDFLAANRVPAKVILMAENKESILPKVEESDISIAPKIVEVGKVAEQAVHL